MVRAQAEDLAGPTGPVLVEALGQPESVLAKETQLASEMASALGLS